MTRIPQCLTPGIALLSHLLVNIPFVFGVIYIKEATWFMVQRAVDLHLEKLCFNPNSAF